MINLEIEIQYNKWHEALDNTTPQKYFELLSNTVIHEISTTTDHPYIQSKNIFLSLLLCDDDNIRLLNKEFRNKDNATNVLSLELGNLQLEGEVHYIGDIALSFDTITKEASQKNIPIKSHITHMFIHGLLHLFGYDHIHEKEAKKMEDLEISLLQSFNIKNPYL